MVSFDLAQLALKGTLEYPSETFRVNDWQVEKKQCRTNLRVVPRMIVKKSGWIKYSQRILPTTKGRKCFFCP